MLRTIKPLRNLLLCICSAGLLILAFPKTDISILAWVGLVPLMFALDGKSPRQAFRLSYFCGLIFFAGTLHWFTHVTGLGATLLVLYCALYFGMFGVGYSYFFQKSSFSKLFMLPSIWVVGEFIRAHFLTGFDWGGLAYSQYKNLAFIQIADVTGMFGTSFFVVMINVLLKEIISAMIMPRKNFKILAPSLIATALLTILVFGYGQWKLNSPRPEGDISIAVVQANIPQDMKWDKSSWPTIMGRYQVLTLEAAKEKPHLIIWPETSFPGMLWKDKATFMKLEDFVKELNIPLLFGSVIKEEGKYHNSAILLSKEAEMIERYDKVHLVPFGEFIPFRSIFPFLEQIVPIGDFTAGNDFTIFPFSPKTPFSVLICFEDTVARLSRQFVLNGAQLLINITNDAWFEDTKAPFMHLQSSVFRTVENRRYLVRSTNTGVSCFIDNLGRILNCVKDHNGKKTYTSGYIIEKISLNSKMTFYTKFGDVFTFACFGCILCGILRRKYI